MSPQFRSTDVDAGPCHYLRVGVDGDLDSPLVRRRQIQTRELQLAVVVVAFHLATSSLPATVRLPQPLTKLGEGNHLNVCPSEERREKFALQHNERDDLPFVRFAGVEAEVK